MGAIMNTIDTVDVIRAIASPEWRSRMIAEGSTVSPALHSATRIRRMISVLNPGASAHPIDSTT